MLVRVGFKKWSMYVDVHSVGPLIPLTMGRIPF